MYAFLAFGLSLRMGGIAMSVKSQGSNMRRLSALLSHDLGYAYGDKERGPNGRKKNFLNTGKAFLRALAKDLGLRDALVSANEGGIAVSGECTLIGMWEEGGIYICLSQPVGGGDHAFADAAGAAEPHPRGQAGGSMRAASAADARGRDAAYSAAC